MSSPQLPENRPDDVPGEHGGPTTDRNRALPPHREHYAPGPYAVGAQPAAPGFPPQPGPGYWPQPGPAYAPQPPSGYGGAPYRQADYGQGGYGQHPGYGQSPYGPGGYRQSGSGPDSQPLGLWATLGIVVFLGVLGAILTLTFLMDVSSAANRVSNICDQYGGAISDICKQSMQNSGLMVPMAAVVYLVLIILGSLTAIGGAILVLLKKHFGQFVILGGGVVMLLFAIVFSAQYSVIGRVTFDLIAGVFIAVAGGLLLVPQIRQVLGIPPTSGPGQFGGSAPQPYPGQYGRPGSGGYPPRQW